MEINQVQNTIKTADRENSDFLSKQTLNQLTDEKLRNIGIENVLNVTIVDIKEELLLVKKGKKQDQVFTGYEYLITMNILHKNYNSNMVLDPSLPKEEVERIKNLMI